KGHFQNQCPKPVALKDKEFHMEVKDYDDTLVCCVENTIEDCIMDSSASFHATYCKEDLERFRLHSGKLAEEGFHLGFRDQQWKVTRGSLVVARGNKRGTLYMVDRLRMPDLQMAVVDFCEPCVLGKQKKVSFIKFGNTRKLQRLELVLTDVYIPTAVASIGGSRYYVTFIDDGNRKCLKFDNGREYSSREFIEYCAENMIRVLKTVPETPQQNGVAKSINQTLDERAKSMRLHAGLSKMF
nr:putative retrovirus-related Pol polyprotein from transposon TNT 1-94 [Tanacetum cinerariifolium]